MRKQRGARGLQRNGKAKTVRRCWARFRLLARGILRWVILPVGLLCSTLCAPAAGTVNSPQWHPLCTLCAHKSARLPDGRLCSGLFIGLAAIARSTLRNFGHHTGPHAIYAALPLALFCKRPLSVDMPRTQLIVRGSGGVALGPKQARPAA